MMSKSNRIVYLDVVKFLAIWMVCIGHSYQIVDMLAPSVLNNWIYSFHMPLFMLLCGFFSLHSFEKSFIDFLKQKSEQLLIPAMTVPLLTILVCFLLHFSDMMSVARAEMIGGMWFLKTLFACMIYAYIFKYWKVYNERVIAVISILIALFFPHGYFLQFNWMLIFFWTGYFLRRYYSFYTLHQFKITILGLLFFVFFAEHQAPLVLTYDVLFSQPFQLLYQYLAGLSGAISCLGCSFYICKWLGEDNAVVRHFVKIGTFTLGIYVLQSIILQRVFVSLVHIHIQTVPDWVYDFIIVPCIALLSVYVCYYCIQVLKNNRLINLFFFGNQY